MLLVIEKLLKLYNMLVVAAGQGIHTCSLVACLVINMPRLYSQMSVLLILCWHQLVLQKIKQKQNNAEIDSTLQYL